MTNHAERPSHEADKALSLEAFRAHRYRDAEDIRPLAEHPSKNRIQVGDIDIAQISTGWKRAFPETSSKVKIQHHTVSLYKNGDPIGFAAFDVFLFNDFVDMREFVMVADIVSQKLYESAEGISSVLERLNGGHFEFAPGMRIGGIRSARDASRLCREILVGRARQRVHPPKIQAFQPRMELRARAAPLPAGI